jgi:hypothetical protein
MNNAYSYLLRWFCLLWSEPTQTIPTIYAQCNVCCVKHLQCVDVHLDVPVLLQINDVQFKRSNLWRIWTRRLGARRIRPHCLSSPEHKTQSNGRCEYPKWTPLRCCIYFLFRSRVTFPFDHISSHSGCSQAHFLFTAGLPALYAGSNWWNNRRWARRPAAKL